ncbi:hypothetical protein DUT90_08755 [Polaribacter sp. WD7]|uniref:hypothetical protein n=1 Tax=Polaribacter sp. WD7 TaxID=2269061 RepID=UPI000DF209BD|nr:hypothetical protein [Polaribacter sp. WD7]RCS27183.1 hypothetical protein DUT90_08755 [Polaribacter sp. WD7]
MKKVIIIFFTILLSTSICSQQKSNFWENVSYGGGIAIGFGNNNSTIGISPSAIYNFNNGFALGAGLGYLRSRINDFTTTAYNTSIISLYQTNYGIQFSGEFEYYFARQRDNFDEVSTNFPALHLGIAYNQGRRFAFGIRYDVLYDDSRSIFASPISPIVRFYF